jgi:hypothetical protein
VLIPADPLFTFDAESKTQLRVLPAFYGSALTASCGNLMGLFFPLHGPMGRTHSAVAGGRNPGLCICLIDGIQ